MQSRLTEQIPRYGWSPMTLFDNVSVSDVDLDTDPVRRPAGLTRVSVRIRTFIGDVGGAGEFTFILEGSNSGDGSNPDDWYELSRLDRTDVFEAPQVATSVIKIMGASDPGIETPPALFINLQGTGDVDVGRYQYLRLRAEVVSGAPTFIATVKVVGTAGDAERFARQISSVSVSGDPNEIVSDYIERPAGTRWLSASTLLNDVILDPPVASGFYTVIEAAIDESDAQSGFFLPFLPQADAGVALTAAGDSVSYQFQGVPSVDMGAYNFFRVRVYNFPASPPTDLSSYRMTTTLSFDDNDWLQGDIGFTELSAEARETFLSVRWGEPEAQVGNTRDITGVFLDAAGGPLATANILAGGISARGVLVLSETPEGAQYSLHPTATATGAEIEASLSPGNIYPIEATADGSFTVTIDSNGVPDTVYASVISYVPVSPRRFVVVQSDIAEVVLT